MIGIAYEGKLLSIEEAQKVLDNNVSMEDFLSSMDGEEKELYEKLSDEDKDKYKDLSFTITTMNEKDGLVEYRNELDEQVVAIFTKK
mgnify:FL=1